MPLRRELLFLIGLYGNGRAMQMPAASKIGVSAEIGSDGVIRSYGGDARDVSALVVTSACPTDNLPVGPMVEHRLRMLVGESSSALIQSTILYNQPNWMNPTDNFRWTSRMLQRRVHLPH